MTLPIDQRDRLYNFDLPADFGMPANNRLLIQLLNQLANGTPSVSFFIYNLTAYEHKGEWRYIFEFAPDHPDHFPRIEYLGNELKQYGVTWNYKPIFYFGDRPRVTDFCTCFEKYGTENVSLRSVITQPMDPDDALICIVVPEAQGKALEQALEASTIFHDPIQLESITCYIGPQTGASQPYCELQSTIKKQSHLYSTAVSWCQDYRIVEIAADYALKADIENITKASKQNFALEPIACYGAIPKLTTVGVFLKIIDELTVKAGLDVISIYSGAMYGANTRTLICVENPHEFLDAINRNKHDSCWR